MDPHPFSSFAIASSAFLEECPGRRPCPSCGRSRKFFCFVCAKAVAGEEQLPRVQLPVRIEIIKHPSEYHGKSTSCHASILAPDHVRIHKYPSVPEFDPKKTLLVFPGSGAKLLKEWLKEDKGLVEDEEEKQEKNEGNGSAEIKGTKRSKEDEEDENPPRKRTRPNPKVWFDTVVLLDCTWNQTGSMSNDERLKELPCVILKDHASKFWRFQRDNPPNFLSTIEAIFYFLLEFHEATLGNYDGRFDNLLFYFKFLYDKLYNMYDGGKDLQAYAKRNFQLKGCSD